MKTDLSQFMLDLDGGNFGDKVAETLSDVAAGCMDFNKPGSIKIELTLKRIGTSHQVEIKHKLSFDRPTLRGKQSEVDTTQTPMFVGEGGKLSLFHETQGDMFNLSNHKTHAEKM